MFYIDWGLTNYDIPKVVDLYGLFDAPPFFDLSGNEFKDDPELDDCDVPLDEDVGDNKDKRVIPKDLKGLKEVFQYISLTIKTKSE